MSSVYSILSALFVKGYRVKSPKISLGCIGIIFGMQVVILVTELLVDLHSLSWPDLVPFILVSGVLLFAEIKFPASSLVSLIVVAQLYILLEMHLLRNPTTFHVVVYWMALVPLISLVLLGLRASYLWVAIVVVTIFANSYWLLEVVGEVYVLSIKRQPFAFGGTLFVLSLMTISCMLYVLVNQKNDELIEVKISVEKKREVLEKYQLVLLELTRKKLIYNIESGELFYEICKTAADCLKISRVSLWMLEENNSRIVRKFLFEKETGNDEKVVLTKKDFPSYFHALETKTYIMANDARIHEDTKEFKEVYLDPLGIYSMFDCPIIIDQKVSGVICCEHQNEIKDWQT